MSAPPSRPQGGPPQQYDSEQPKKKKKKGDPKSGLDAVIPQSRIAPKRPTGSKPKFDNAPGQKNKAGPPGKAPPDHAPPIAAAQQPGGNPVRVRKAPPKRRAAPLPSGPVPEQKNAPTGQARRGVSSMIR